MGLKSTSFFLPATLDTPLLKYEESCLPCKLYGIINLFQGNHHQSNLVNHELRKRFSYHAVWYSLQQLHLIVNLNMLLQICCGCFTKQLVMFLLFCFVHSRSIQGGKALLSLRRQFNRNLIEAGRGGRCMGKSWEGVKDILA